MASHPLAVDEGSRSAPRTLGRRGCLHVAR
jgi:hypothetical protein